MKRYFTISFLGILLTLSCIGFIACSEKKPEGAYCIFTNVEQDMFSVKVLDGEEGTLPIYREDLAYYFGEKYGNYDAESDFYSVDWKIYTRDGELIENGSVTLNAAELEGGYYLRVPEDGNECYDVELELTDKITPEFIFDESGTLAVEDGIYTYMYDGKVHYPKVVGAKFGDKEYKLKHDETGYITGGNEPIMVDEVVNVNYVIPQNSYEEEIANILFLPGKVSTEVEIVGEKLSFGNTYTGEVPANSRIAFEMNVEKNSVCRFNFTKGSQSLRMESRYKRESGDSIGYLDAFLEGNYKNVFYLSNESETSQEYAFTFSDEVIRWEGEEINDFSELQTILSFTPSHNGDFNISVIPNDVIELEIYDESLIRRGIYRMNGSYRVDQEVFLKGNETVYFVVTKTFKDSLPSVGLEWAPERITSNRFTLANTEDYNICIFKSEATIPYKFWVEGEGKLELYKADGSKWDGYAIENEQYYIVLSGAYHVTVNVKINI